MAFSAGKLVHDHPLATGLQLWLPGMKPFAGGGRWLNIARPWNDGTATGTVSWAGNYRHGMAFRGNGTNAYYSVDTTGLVDLPDSGMAMACSVKWTVTTANQYIFGFSSTTDNDPILYITTGDTSGAKLRLFQRNSAAVTGPNFSSSANYNDFLWHRVFVWRSNTSGGSYRFSVDGVSLSTGSMSANPTTPNRLTVGALVRAAISNYFSGGVSDCMLWRLPIDSKPIEELEMMRWDYEEWSKGWPELLNRRRRPVSVIVSAPAGIAANPLRGGGAAAVPLWGYIG